MGEPNEYELERAARIARNKAELERLTAGLAMPASVRLTTGAVSFVCLQSLLPRQAPPPAPAPADEERCAPLRRRAGERAAPEGPLLSSGVPKSGRV